MRLPREEVMKYEREDIPFDNIIEDYQTIERNALESISTEDFALFDGYLAGISSMLSDYGSLLEDYITPEFILCLAEYIQNGGSDSDAVNILGMISASDSLPEHLTDTMLSCAIFHPDIFKDLEFTLQNQIITMVGNLLSLMPEEQRNELLDFLVPIVLTRMVSDNPGESFRFIYTLLCTVPEYFSPDSIPESAVALKNVIMEMRDDNENLLLIFHSLFKLLNESTYQLIFFDDDFCIRCNSLIGSVDAQTLSSLLICFSKFAELLPKNEPEHLQRVNIAEIIEIIGQTISDQEYACARVDCLQFLVNAAACDGMGPVILSIPNIIDFLLREITNGSFDEVTNAIAFYNNLIDRNDIAKRLEMSTNDVMREIIHTISIVPNHYTTRKVVKTLCLTMRKAIEEERSQEFIDFLMDEWDYIDTVMNETESRDVSSLIQSLEDFLFDE